MRTVFQVEGKEPMHMENRAGYYKTDLSGEMASLLVKANSGLAVLESVATCIPNVDLFVSMYVCKEALMSSQIEGT